MTLTERLAATARRGWESPTLMSWGSLVARLSGLAVLLPLVLRAYPTEAVALWLWFGSVSALQIVGDVGFSQTFARALAFASGGATVHGLQRLSQAQRPASDGLPNQETHDRILQTLGPVYLWLTLGLAALLGVAGTLAVRELVTIQGNPTQAWLAWASVLLTSAVLLWGNSYLSYLLGSNQVALVRRWEMITAVIGTGCAVLVVILGGKLLALVLTQQVWLVLGVARNYWLCRRSNGFWLSVRARPDREVLAVLWPPAWRSGIGILMGFGLIQASGIVYARLATVDAAASFLLALRLMQAVSQFSQAPFYSKIPELNLLRAQGRYDDQLQLAQRGMRYSLWAFAVAAIGVPAVIEPLLYMLQSETRFVSIPLWGLIAAAFFVERLGGMHMQLYTTTNHIIWHWVNGLTGLAMIVAAVLLYPYLGVSSLPLGMFLAYTLIYLPLAMRYSQREFSFNLLRFEATTSLPPLMLCLAGISALFLLHALGFSPR